MPVIPAEEGKAGQLLRVKLINFMSHAHFEVYFRWADPVCIVRR